MQQLQFHMPTPKRRGRPRQHPIGCARHKQRRVFAKRMPIHVTMRLAADIANARKFELYRAIRAATVTAMIGARVRIVHFSIQRTHLHAIVEADATMELARGMQGFQISAARRINRALGELRGRTRKGRVFADRYHAHYLESPRETRHAIRYVLNNWRHHAEDLRGGVFARFRVDPFSTGPLFGGFSDWNTEGYVVPSRWPPRYQPLVVYFPRTWLLATGWRERGGGRFSVRDVPVRSPPPVARRPPNAAPPDPVEPRRPTGTERAAERPRLKSPP